MEESRLKNWVYVHVRISISTDQSVTVKVVPVQSGGGRGEDERKRGGGREGGEGGEEEEPPKKKAKVMLLQVKRKGTKHHVYIRVRTYVTL